MTEPLKINWNLERFFYRTMEYDQNHRGSAYREIRKLGMLWVRNKIIIAFMNRKNCLIITVDDSFKEEHFKFLESFGFEIVGVSLDGEWNSYEIQF